MNAHDEIHAREHTKENYWDKEANKGNKISETASKQKEQHEA